MAAGVGKVGSGVADSGGQQVANEPVAMTITATGDAGGAQQAPRAECAEPGGTLSAAPPLVAPGAPGWNGSLPLQEVPLVNYEMVAEQGRGGIGIVRRARDRRLDRDVAVKELQRDSHDARLRFEREMRTTAKLQHPGVVPVHEAGCWPDGSPFYAMKLVEGRSLKEIIAESATLDDRLGLLPHVLAIAETIAYAHSKGVIHRDLKPSNVIVGAYGETVVIDWGLAKHLDEPTANATTFDGNPYRMLPDEGLTIIGQVLGTPSYMPPEQARGNEVDERADIYAVGAILYHVLAGEAPYRGTSSAEILAKLLSAPPSSISQCEPGVPEDLAAIVGKAMHRDSDERYTSADLLVQDLRRFQTGQLVGAHQYTGRELLGRWARKHRTNLAIAGAAVVLLIGIGSLAITRIVAAGREAESQRDVATKSKDDVIFAQAVQSLTHDPTATVAWAKAYPATGARRPELLGIVREARALGVARFVTEEPSGLVLEATFLGPSHYVVTLALDSADLWDAARGKPVARQQRTFISGGIITAVTSARAIFLSEDTTLAIADASAPAARFWTIQATGAIVKFSLAADGATVAYQLSDGSIWTVDISEPAMGKARRIAVAPDAVTIALSNDSRYLFVVPANGHLTALDPENGQTMADLVLTFRAQKIFAVDLAGTIALRAETGAMYATHFNGSEFASPLAVARREAYALPTGFLIADAADTVDVWMTPDKGPHKAAVDIHRATTFDASADMTIFATGDSSGGISVWSEPDSRHMALQGHTSRIEALALSQDGRDLFSASRDGKVRIWPIERTAAKTIANHSNQVYDMAAVGDQVVSTDCDGGIHVSDVLGSHYSKIALDYRTCPILAVAPGGKSFAVGTHTGKVYEVGLATTKPGLIISPPNSLDVENLKYSNSGRWLAVSFRKNTTVTILSRPQGQSVSLDLHGHGTDMVFSSDDQRLFVALDSGAVATIELQTLSVRTTAVDPFPRRLLCVDRQLIIGTSDGRVLAMSQEKAGGQPTVLASRPSRVETMIERQGTIVVAYRDGFLGLIEPGTSRSMRTIRVCREAVGTVRSAPDGFAIVALCRDGLLKFVNPQSLNMDVLKVANDATSLIVAGRQAVVGDMEGHVTVWDLRTLKSLDLARPQELEAISSATTDSI